MRVRTRYLLLQAPGWVFLLLILVVLRVWLDLPLWLCVTAVAVWIGKDLVLYPLVKTAYDSASVRSPGERLVGQRGRVERDLDPDGYVRIRGELWKATLSADATRMERGEAVRVCRVDRMRLYVEPDS